TTGDGGAARHAPNLALCRAAKSLAEGGRNPSESAAILPHPYISAAPITGRAFRLPPAGPESRRPPATAAAGSSCRTPPPSPLPARPGSHSGSCEPPPAGGWGGV